MTSENLLDVLASVEHHRDELQDAIRHAVRVLQDALDEFDSSRPQTSKWVPAHPPVSKSEQDHA